VRGWDSDPGKVSHFGTRKSPYNLSILQTAKMIKLFKHFKILPPAKKKLTAKAWIIDPVKQSVSELASPYFPSLVEPIVGADAECYKLDTHDTVVWMSDTDTNKRFAYYWEGMDYPFNVRRYSKALVVSLGPQYWSVETIMDYLRWHDKKNPWGDV
jgi:hypothetical protein